MQKLKHNCKAVVCSYRVFRNSFETPCFREEQNVSIKDLAVIWFCAYLWFQATRRTFSSAIAYLFFAKKIYIYIHKIILINTYLIAAKCSMLLQINIQFIIDPMQYFQYYSFLQPQFSFYNHRLKNCKNKLSTFLYTQFKCTC